MKTRFVLFLLCCFASSSAFAQVQRPGWPLKVLSWDIDKAYPGVEYNYRLAVQGGVYPYTFTLQSGPGGMVIGAHTGEIRWVPDEESQGNEVHVLVTDSVGDTLTHSFVVSADRSFFRFVASGGIDSNTGTEASPWGSIAYASANAGVNRYVYVKSGSYPAAMSINATKCGRFLAWPGDDVTIVGAGSGSSSISINGGERMIFQGFTFDANDRRWLFSCDAGLLQNLIWRNNTMHNVYSNDWENPAFVFFWDGSQKPIEGQVHYKNIVMQNNVFHDLRNPNDHGASTTLYDVQDLIYEDNIAHDIDGRGVSDKDDGFRNTFRNNLFYECQTGVGLYNQYSQGSIDVSYNLIHGCGSGIVLGGQPGYLRDVFVYRNTIVGGIHYSHVLNAPESTNFHVFGNIVGTGTTRAYSFSPIRVNDVGDAYHYEYPLWFQHSDPKVRIDRNLLWANASNVAGYDWGIPTTNWSTWQSKGYDVNGVLGDPGLNATTFQLAPTSPYFGVFGRDNPFVNLPGSNRPPALAPIGDKSTPAGQPFQFTVHAADADGNQLQYSATGGQ